MNKKNTEFLYQSIADAQGTIRAIDTKLGFLFVVVFLPVVAIPKIQDVHSLTEDIWWYVALSIAVVGLWLAALFFLYRALVSIKSPALSIENLEVTNGDSFYNGELFTLNPYDAFVNKKQKSNKTVANKVEELPTNEDELVKILMYESLKLAYIRDLKMLRSNYCMNCTFAFVFLGTLVWTFTEFKIGLGG